MAYRLSSILFSAGTLLVYAPYVYARYIVGEFHKFPEPVAKKLRRALYYTNHRLDPSEALKYYRQALEVADELGVDPFSDEMLGVKIQVSALYEKIKNYDAAIKTLEVIRRDCLDWVGLLGDKHWNDGKRTRVLAKAVAISLKLGELYSNEYVQDKEAAEEQLVWAVETVLKEKQRRDKEGVKEGEGEWISNEEFGNALVCTSLPSDSSGSTRSLIRLQLSPTTTRSKINTTSRLLSSSKHSQSSLQIPATPWS